MTQSKFGQALLSLFLYPAILVRKKDYTACLNVKIPAIVIGRDTKFNMKLTIYNMHINVLYQAYCSQEFIN